MKGKFGAVTQVSLALLLSLSLGFMTAMPSMAQESVSISPETAEYYLDDPQDFISTKITWGDASRVRAITDDERDLTPGLENDYKVLDNTSTLLILNRYLEEKLTEDVNSAVLTIEFDVGLNATFTIKPKRTQPTIDPEDAYYDLVDTADVETTIEWHEAQEVVSIFDNHGYRLQENIDYTTEVIVFSTTARLTILSDPYLEDKLTAAGQSVALIIEFDFGDDAPFNITAIEKPPSISPEKAEYDLDNRAAVSTTITWGSADAVDTVTENVGENDNESDNPLTLGVHYTVEDIGGGKATLTINESYLNGKLKDKDIGKSVVLTIAFDVGDPVGFNITASGTRATIDPEDAIYDRLDPADVTITITWRDAKNVTSIVHDGYELQSDDYSVTPIDEEKATLTINDSYLNGKLERWRDEVELSIGFGDEYSRKLTIRAVDAHPTIDDPTGAEYDLNHPADVTITITSWQDPPTKVVSIADGERELQEPAHYSVTTNDDGTATLEIVRRSYLRFKIKEIGDGVELTVAFNVGDDDKFAIEAVRNPRIDADDAHYEWDDPPDFVVTGITWGSVSEIDAITDNKGKGYVLTRGENGDYMVLGNTLVILDKYLKDKLSDLKPVTLTIAFHGGNPVEFNITPIGTHPTINPAVAPYGRHDPDDVATTIRWGSATDVVSIVDGEGELGENDDYSVARIYDDDGEDTGTATLTIFYDPYLESRFEDSPTSLNLTIDFDVGANRAFEITTGDCFIATAAYGTPLAEEIQVLREFRDGCLLTNSLGQAFVDFYYSTSPPIAEFINEHPSLKPVVRAGLLPAVAMSAVAVNTTPAEKAAIIGLLALVSVAAAVWTARRRRRGPEYT